jgi:hypothetical protein
LTTPEEIEVWMMAPANETLALQRRLPGDALRIVVRGQKQDDGGSPEPIVPPAEPLLL